MPREDDQDLLHAARNEELRQASDPRTLLDAYAERRYDCGREKGDLELDIIAPEAIAALRAVLDMADLMEDNADIQETNGTDPMVIHQKRHVLECFRTAITTALKQGDEK